VPQAPNYLKSKTKINDSLRDLETLLNAATLPDLNGIVNCLMQVSLKPALPFSVLEHTLLHKKA